MNNKNKNPYQCPYCSNTPNYNYDYSYQSNNMNPASYYDNIASSNELKEQNTNQYDNPYYTLNNQEYSQPYDTPYDNQYYYQYMNYDNYSYYNGLVNNYPLQTMQNAKDYGPDPYVVNIDEATRQNESFRSTLWTGTHLQVTLMSLDMNEDIGLEIHNDVDQFIRVEEGSGVVMMGNNQNNLDFQEEISDDFAIMIPAGKWHNIRNTGNTPLKLYSIYAPPAHPHGTVHNTKEDAESAERNSMY